MLNVNFSPYPVLETERLLLRCIRKEDADQFFILRSDPLTMKYLDRDPFKSIEETIDFINDKILSILELNEGIHWVVELKENPGKLIGFAGFWKIDKENYRAETGYMLLPEYWRKGIMKEAVKATIDWAFATTEIHSIEANINPGNSSSAALLRGLGFIQEAYFKENYFYNGIFKDTIIYSLLKP